MATAYVGFDSLNHNFFFYGYCWKTNTNLLSLRKITYIHTTIIHAAITCKNNKSQVRKQIVVIMFYNLQNIQNLQIMIISHVLQIRACEFGLEIDDD